jgi:hypothetical protein
VVSGGAVTEVVPTGPSTMPFGVACVGPRTFVSLALASRIVELPIRAVTPHTHRS